MCGNRDDLSTYLRILNFQNRHPSLEHSSVYSLSIKEKIILKGRIYIIKGVRRVWSL